MLKQVLSKYSIPSDIKTIESFTETKWKELVTKKTLLYANENLKGQMQQLSKASLIMAYKTSYSQEPYLYQLTQRKAAAIFRLRTRMLKLKNNFKRENTSLYCDRCNHQEIDNEKHLLSCPQLRTLRDKFSVHSFDSVFSSTATKEVLEDIAAFLIECDLLPPIF